MTEPSTPAPSDPDREPDTTEEPEDARPSQPVWWVAVPVLVAAAAVYRLAQGDTGGIWPWGDVAMLVVALLLLAFVLVDRRRTRP